MCPTPARFLPSFTPPPPYGYDIATSYLSSLLLKAKSLCLRHLRIDLPYDELLDIFPLILSVETLESLIIDSWLNDRQFILPSTTFLPLLKSLTLKLCWIDCEKLNEFVSKLPSLRELSLEGRDIEAFNLTFQTLTKLKLIIKCDDTFGDARAMMVRLSMPNLESLHFHSLMCMPSFSGEMPQLRTASIIIDYHSKKCVGDTFNLLTSLVNVEELKLDIEEHWAEHHPYHMFVVPGKILPNFYNLKSIDLSCCFHKKNIENLIGLVQSSPALESLKLVHVGPNMPRTSKDRKRMLWKSKLPNNPEGNNQHADFMDLHIDENKNELVKRLATKLTSKEVKIQK